VTVAVIDSGLCASHADLTGRIAAGGWDFLAKRRGPWMISVMGVLSGVIAANMNDGLALPVLHRMPRSCHYAP
jgi:hypothetical protein